MPIETFNISFDSTPNKQQYGTKNYRHRVKGEKIMVIRNYEVKNRILGGPDL